MTFNKFSLLGLLAVAASLAFAPAAQAAVGLYGAYYKTGSLDSLAQAEAAIIGKAPDVTFIATKVCYPTCHTSSSNNQTLNAFLGSNATNISANTISDLTGHVIVLTGQIYIPTTGMHTLGIGSDDGAKMTVGGQTLLNDGLHGYQFVSQDFWFTAGYHDIRIVQFEKAGNTGLIPTWSWRRSPEHGRSHRET